MQKIIIKHLAGSKSNQTEIFELPIKEIIFGRDSSCLVMFDPDKDDLVSRLHCKITVQNENQFLLTDLNSRNGTFVNNARITSPHQLQVGDVVQLGKGGAQFAFDLDPRPQTVPKATRLGDAIPGAAATREHRVDPTFEPGSSGKPEQRQTKSTTSDSPKPAGIGKETLMRTIYEADTKTRKKMINYGAGIIAIIAAVSGAFVYTTYQGQQAFDDSNRDQEEQRREAERKMAELMAKQGVTSTEISKKFGDSTVFIETSWKLVHISTGKQIFQKKVCVKVEKNKCVTELPLYKFVNGVVEPDLTLDDGIPIGGSGSGSGFVVREDGYILTNRHVAMNWQARYTNFELPGALKICRDDGCSKNLAVLPNDPNNEYVASLNKWIPSKAIYKPLHGKSVEGRIDYLDVTFPKTGLRIPGGKVTPSDIADVALFKIDVPRKLEPVEMSVDDTVSAGDSITVMGYPGISPDRVAKMNCQDRLGGECGELQIPEPTVTGGNIGKVIQGSATTTSDSVSEYISAMGDVYQLTVNATGSGNSGGPVFNKKGHVIGIFTSKRIDESGTIITFAVPIKYGQEIMGNNKLSQ